MNKNQILVTIFSALTGFVLVFLVIAYPLSEEVNKFTRADVSKHVTNISCGIGNQCYGSLSCHQGLNWNYRDGNITGFDTDRVNGNITEPRCVKEPYLEDYCGLFETRATLQSWPPSASECREYDSLKRKFAAFLNEYL
ncbi:hypothetical protein [Candidatus Nanohalococcus occultus]|uniref:hypothetical protein n=1 Tax=Candidatus Nanohalococcus occultus TaxID=2978047 RepID=UPI0039E07C64